MQPRNSFGWSWTAIGTRCASPCANDGSGFCHTGEPACWPSPFSLASLGKVIEERQRQSDGGEDSTSGTARVLADPGLLKAKLLEEAVELSEAQDPKSATHEAADLIYFALVAAARHGVGLEEIRRELENRNRRVRRRPMAAKPKEGTK